MGWISQVVRESRMLAIALFVLALLAGTQGAFPRHDEVDEAAIVDIHNIKPVGFAEMAGSNAKPALFKLVKGDNRAWEDKAQDFHDMAALSLLELNAPEIPDPIGCVCEYLTDGGKAGSSGQTDQNSLLELNVATKRLTPNQRSNSPFNFATQVYSCTESSDSIDCVANPSL